MPESLSFFQIFSSLSPKTRTLKHIFHPQSAPNPILTKIGPKNFNFRVDSSIKKGFAAISYRFEGIFVFSFGFSSSGKISLSSSFLAFLCELKLHMFEFPCFYARLGVCFVICVLNSMNHSINFMNFCGWTVISEFLPNFGLLLVYCCSKAYWWIVGL